MYKKNIHIYIYDTKKMCKHILNVKHSNKHTDTHTYILLVYIYILLVYIIITYIIIHIY